MKKAVAYARFSTDMQREESIDAQIRAIKEYCKRKDILLIDKYVDEGISGTTDNRPSFQAMIKDSYKHEFDYVIVHKLDRFTRSKYDSAIYKRTLKKNNIRVLSVLENLDDSPESLILESVLEGMSEYYSRNLSREVKKGMKENALKCKFNGGTAPLGFDIDENKDYIVNKKESEAVKIIFEHYVLGYSYNEIITLLNQKGYKTKTGKAFGKNSLYEILRNEKYIGNYIYSKENYDGFSNKRNSHSLKNRDDMIIIEGGIPSIIDKGIWNKAQEILKSKKRLGGNNKLYDYILTGLVYCAECDTKMKGTSRKNEKGQKYHYYRCETKNSHKRKSIRADVLEDKILDMCNDCLFNEENKNTILKFMQEYLKNDKGDSAELKKELRKIEKNIDNIVNAILDGTNSASLKQKLSELEDKKTFLQSEIRFQEMNLKENNVELLSNFLEKHKDIKKYDKKEQKLIVNLLINKIKINKKEIAVQLNAISDSQSMCDCGAGNPRQYLNINLIVIKIEV